MKIGIVSRLDVYESIQLTDKIVEFLLKRNIEILLENDVVDRLNKYEELSCPLEEMEADIIIAVGGDGTILRTQRFISSKKIPLLGINMGTVGFLTEIDPENTFKSLNQALQTGIQAYRSPR